MYKMDLESEAVEDRGRGRRGTGGDSGSSVVLGPRDSLVGRLTVEGDLRIQGTVEGEIRGTGDVQIDPDSNITATVDGRNVTIRGQVTGNVTASEKLVLAGNGNVTGDVRVARLAVEDGATLNGNVTMGGIGSGRGSGGFGSSGNESGTGSAGSGRGHRAAEVRSGAAQAGAAATTTADEEEDEGAELA
jgi:cytoskeletal protein CcmA (bactofilin family)